MRRRALAIAILSSSLPGAKTVAGEWATDAGMAVGTYYSDNICLSDLDKKDQWVGTARPDIAVNGSGGRFSMNLNAGVEYNSLGQSDVSCAAGQGRNLANREAVVPRVNMNSEFEMLRDWLTVEATAFAGQNPINPFAAGGNDAINARENTNITYRYGVGARSERRIDDRARFAARYNYDEQYNAIALLGDSTSNSAQVSLGTDPAAARLSLGISANYRRVEFEESTLRPAFSNDFGSAEVNTAFRINRFFALDGRAGEEFNDFLSVDEDIDGSFWDAGFSWTPNTRVSVSAGYGERFFGATPRLEASYRHKRSDVIISYLRTVTLPRNLRGQFARPDEPFPDLDELPGDPLGGIGQETFIGQGPIQSDTLSLNWGFQARRTGLRLNARESQQTRFETGASATFRNVSLTLTRQLGAYMSTDLSVGWRKNEGDDDSIGLFGQQIEAWTGSWGISRRLGNDTTLSLRYRYTDQQANNDFNTFTENRVSLNLRFRF